MNIDLIIEAGYDTPDLLADFLMLDTGEQDEIYRAAVGKQSCACGLPENRASDMRHSRRTDERENSMINTHVQKLIDRHGTDTMNTKGSALRSEIRKSPPGSHAAAWTVYAILTASARFKPTNSDTPEYQAYEDATDAIMNILGNLIWPDGLSPTPCFRAHLSPERYKEAAKRHG
jgi:hypothetical protein